MDRNNSKYLLSFDFRIFYCPDICLIGASRELNQENLRFEPYTKGKDIIQYAYPIDADDINYIVKSVLMGKISYLLDEKNLKWIKEFETLSINQPDIWENDKYVFNYLTLKIILMGFSQSTALDIVKTYFKYKRNGQPIIELKKMVKSINKIVDSKEFWITNKMIEFEEIETAFLEQVLKNKIKTGFNFDYRYFERSYVEICKNSFSKENYFINSTKLYPVKKTKNLQDQIPYIFQSYESIITSITNDLVINKYPELQQESKFLTNLISCMKNTLSITISSWE